MGKTVGKPKIVVRTCVICRQTADKGSLKRFVVEGQTIKLDSKKKLGGRGVYVHPVCMNSDGLNHQKLKNIFKRAFKVSSLEFMLLVE